MHVTLQVWDIGGQSLGGKMLDKYIFGAHVSGPFMYNTMYETLFGLLVLGTQIQADLSRPFVF